MTVGLPPIGQEFVILSDPSFRWTESGTAHCKLFVKAAQRIKDDTAKGGWRDGKEFTATADIYSRPAAKGQTMAENAYESFKKGDLVVIVGNPYIREYELNGVRDGKGKPVMQKVINIDVDAIGPSLRFRTTPHGAARREEPKVQHLSNDGVGGSTTVYEPADRNDEEPPF